MPENTTDSKTQTSGELNETDKRQFYHGTTNNGNEQDSQEEQQ